MSKNNVAAAAPRETKITADPRVDHSKLIRFLLHKGDFSVFCVHLIATLLGIDEMIPLMTTCRGMYYEDATVLYLAPKVWNNHNEIRSIVRALMSMGSRWQVWVRTLNVEQIMLGVEENVVVDQNNNANVVSDDWIHFIVGSGKFPRLTSINLCCCRSITGASLTEIARGYPALVSLNVRYCDKVTDASVIAIARQCPHLTCINLGGCINISHASITEIARGCPQLTSLNLENCNNTTDASVVDIARGCPEITSIDLGGCSKVSDESVIVFAKGHSNSQLTSINLWGCCKLTDAGIVKLVKVCSHLKAISLNWCINITDASLVAIARGCPRLASIKLDT